MSEKNSFSITSANSYSQALYELAYESNSLDLIENQVTAITNLISQSEDFNLFIKNPINKKEDYFMQKKY